MQTSVATADARIIDLATERVRSRAYAIAAAVPDPEIPVVTIADLGILRDVIVSEDGSVTARITPTYSGCPATQMIEDLVREALENAGFETPRVESVMSPPWTTDWITEGGREKLRAFGIAPPVESAGTKRDLFGRTPVSCPRCGSAQTERVSEFGSTPCKALYRCTSCREPFDYFKCL